MPYSIEKSPVLVFNRVVVAAFLRTFASRPSLNPASTNINIVNADLYESIEVYGVNGQLISQQEINTSEEKLDISDVKEGIYFIHLIKGETKSIHKFVKK